MTELLAIMQEKLLEAKRLRTRVINSVYPAGAEQYADGLVDGINVAINTIQTKLTSAATTEPRSDQ